MGREQYIRGPGRRRTQSKASAETNKAFAQIVAHYDDEPTYLLTTTVRGVRVVLVVNPNICEICHGRRHSPTRHHTFEPDRATVEMARRVGWTIPTDTEDRLL